VEVATMMTAEETVFILWCRLTGNDHQEFGEDERDSFIARPQVAELARTPYAVLLDAGITAARRGSLPLERWLTAVRTVRPEQRSTRRFPIGLAG
jgi:hypothetical protein